eukprot:TRINITY_DN22428_c0_g1_i1.p1 TRINITY_DN22428_c0_g1~~TRINITY_DN22428_c0_g1_i1.p1  ORF type:complete len:480 (+),score=138.84 TRINITY_DN22428_c0_g1_i1:216-1655(+)
MWTLADVDLPFGLALHEGAWIFALFFVVPTIILSLVQIYGHLKHYSDPSVQRHLVRIILMIPIYSIDSYMSLVMKDLAVYFDVVRDCYEAYVLYEFVRLLAEYTGGDELLIQELESRPEIRYVMPLCCWHVKPGRTFYHRCRQMILQYTVLQVVLTVATFICQMTGTFGEGSWSPRTGYVYITVVYNISITIALYFLVQFYEGAKPFLAPFKPVSKFLCIKSIVFLAYWQSIGISVCEYFGLVVYAPHGWTEHDVSTALQNFLLCLEVLPIAVAFWFCFSFASYRNERLISRRSRARSNALEMFTGFIDVVNVRDTLLDTHSALKFEPQRHSVVAGDFFSLSKEEQMRQALCQGFLVKRGEDLIKNWKMRYFVLIRKPPGLLYFKQNPFLSTQADTAGAGRGWISLADVDDENVAETKDGFTIKTPNRRWQMRCESREDRAKWLLLIRSVVSAVALELSGSQRRFQMRSSDRHSPLQQV